MWYSLKFESKCVSYNLMSTYVIGTQQYTINQVAKVGIPSEELFLPNYRLLNSPVLSSGERKVLNQVKYFLKN